MISALGGGADRTNRRRQPNTSAGPSLFAGLVIGVLTGVGSLLYCFTLERLPVSVVVSLSNLYIVITILLGIVVLGEPVTALKIAGLIATLAGVLALADPPARYGVNPDVGSGGKAVPSRAFVGMGIYIVIIGVAAFLEKPALRGLDATQLNALMAVAMTAVEGVALAVRGQRLPRTTRTLAGIGVGAMIGVASVFYLLGLRALPVSVAAASANAYVVITVLLLTVVLRQRLTRKRKGAIALTLVGGNAARAIRQLTPRHGAARPSANLRVPAGHVDHGETLPRSYVRQSCVGASVDEN